MVLWNFDFLWKNYGTMEKNYGTMDKTIVQWKKNYGTIPRTTKIRFTMVKNMGFFTQTNGKTMVIYQNIQNFDLLRKTMVLWK